MKLGTIALTFAFCGTAALAATPLFQEEAGMTAAKPGPHHEVLKMQAGTWDAKFDMGGQVSDGIYKRELALNDLWLISEYEGSMVGMPFTGHEILGWDEAKEKYVSVWVDSFSTTMSYMEGTWDADSRIMTLSGPSVDPMTGEDATMFYVVNMPDDDTMIFQMHMGDTSTPSMMKITYTRK